MLTSYKLLSRNNLRRRKLKTRSPAVARTAGHTGCHWPWRSSKVNDSHLIWKV